MEKAPIRIAGLGRIGGSDVASLVTEEAIGIGAEVDFIVESDQYGEFNQGLIDWRTVLGNKHWLVLSSEGPLVGDSMKAAWGSSLGLAQNLRSTLFSSNTRRTRRLILMSAPCLPKRWCVRVTK